MFTFLKTPKGLIITGTIVFIIVLIISYYWDKIFKSSSVTYRLIGGKKVITPSVSTVLCNSDCLVPYSEGSRYFGYYYCRPNCSQKAQSFTIMPPMPVNPTNLTTKPQGIVAWGK